jgi:hypothetical protein
MIYILFPYDNVGAMRVFGNFGMMEQVVLRQANMRMQWHLDPDWCTVYGYEEGADEFVPIWVWHVGPSGNLIREPFSR